MNNKSRLLRKFRVDLAERDKNINISFHKLKYQYDYPELCYIIDRIDSNPLYDNAIYGQILPNSILELGDSKVLYGEATDVLEREINWTLLSVRKNTEKLQIFVDKKKEYEESLLIGNYDEANLTLDYIEKNICTSLWGIEQRFLLIEIQNGLKENTSYLNDINEHSKKWFIKRFSHFFSLKAEKELSVNQYNISLARLLARYIESDNLSDLHYYNFKLNFLEISQKESLSDFLAIEGYHSIIDRYITLIRVLQLIVQSDYENKKDFIESRVFYLSKKINDFEIDKLRLLVDSKQSFKLNLRNQDLIAIRALDLYTNEKYDEVIQLLEIKIILYPLSIELYDIYLKSIIVLDRPFQTIGSNPDSFQNKILRSLYGILTREDTLPECISEIRKIAYNLSSIYSISYYLMNCYKQEVESNSTLHYHNVINTNFLNPRLYEIFKSKDTLNSIPDIIASSSSLAYILLSKSESEEIIDQSNLSAKRKSILKAYYFQQNNNFSQAVQFWYSCLQDQTTKKFQIERILQNLFICLEQLKEFDEFIFLFIKYYFENPRLVSNIHVDKIKTKIKSAKYRNVSHNIDLPLFYKVTNSEDYDVHTAYECFLLSNDCFTPSDYIKSDKHITNKEIFFLNNICTLDIFKHSPFITSSKDKYNQRILVCEALCRVDVSNELEYVEEIERLTRRLIIQKGIQEVDESKIYVNQTGIIETELRNISSIFKRFKTIGELRSEKEISILSLYSDKMYSYKVSGENDGNEFSKDPQFDLYKDIFYFIREKFLFSNYGLQQYLSARIRHGVLLGEIRPEFEDLYLITEKQKGVDIYKDNLYWNFTSILKGSIEYLQLQKAFSDFSSRVDSLINEEILDKCLQIRTDEENPDGWLNYSYNDLDLQLSYIIHKDIDNVEKFSNSIFDVLWRRTGENLDCIRAKINDEIKEQFFDLILRLEKGVQAVFGDIPEPLINNINEARVNIENKLIKVANWFSITESNISDFQIEKIIDVSHEYNKNIQLYKLVHSNSYFKGKYFAALVDLIRIFMHNASKHAGFEDSLLPFYVDVKEDHRSLTLEFRNPLADTVDLVELRAKIHSFSMDYNKSMKERGSGFHKAMRIIKEDLNSQENDMLLFVNDDSEFNTFITIEKNSLLL